MIRVISGGVLAAGLALALYGFSASQAFSSDVSRFFTGNPTDRAMWLLIVGGVLIVAGVVGLIGGGKISRA